MTEVETIRFRAVLASKAEADDVAEEVREQGGEASVTEEAGLLPLAVMLAVVIPPGIGILAATISHIIHGWKDKGSIIDARGDGDPKVISAPDLPHGTVVILTRDGDEATRTDLPTEKLGDYIAAALKALTPGASATDAANAAAGAVA
jgi:hypothetical protein